MYLSRIAINKERREARRALSNLEVMHASVLSSFPPKDEKANEKGEGKVRTLWRVDQMGSTIWLYVLSEERPDFTHIVEQYGWPKSDQTWDTKDYLKLLDKIQQGQTWNFRLHANPVRTIEGKVSAHVTVEHQKEWLRARAEKNGFSFVQTGSSEFSEDAFDVIERDIITFKKNRNDPAKVTLSVATFEGFLRVENKELLTHALCFGIGRAKAYGCGLLTLAPPHE